MALSSTVIVPSVDPNSLDTSNAASKVYEPQSGTPTAKNDVVYNYQVIENQIFTLKDTKVAKAGDTMTGPLGINSATTNTTALTATGNGTGYGAQINAGTSSTATAPTIACLVGNGSVVLNGTSPNSGVDPGANNAIHGANIPKAHGTVSLTGGAPYSVQDGYNVTNVTLPFANIYRINFVRAFANNTYSITFTPHAPGIGVSISTKNVAYCEFNVWDTTAPGTPVPNETVDFIAIGRQ